MLPLHRFTFILSLLFLTSLAHARPFRLALLVPLTGPVASLGEYVKQGVTLAFDRLEPTQREQIELIIEDDQFDPKQTLAIYQRLSLDRALDGIFVLGSPPANVLAPITEQKG